MVTRLVLDHIRVILELRENSPSDPQVTWRLVLQTPHGDWTSEHVQDRHWFEQSPGYVVEELAREIAATLKDAVTDRIKDAYIAESLVQAAHAHRPVNPFQWWGKV